VNMTNAGNNWYTYTFTNITSTNLIFNDGTNQTADLTRNKDGWYLNGAWYDTDPGTPTGTTWYQIVNRWQANTYLYDGGNGQVKYGTNPGTNTAYQWTQVDAGSGFVYLKNRSTGNYMYVENQTGYVQCGAINSTWYSAMWTIAPTGDGWDYIRNRWQTSEWIHIENLLGYAQYANPQTGWYSAPWQLVNPVTVSAVTPGMSNAVAAGLDQTAGDAVRLFPDPARVGQRIRVTAPDNALVTFRDLSGRTLLIIRLASTGEVDPGLPAGIYFVTIRCKDHTVTKKIVIY